MKKIILIVKTFFIIFLLTSCGQDSAKRSDNTIKYISGTILKGKVVQGKVSVYQEDGETLIGEDLFIEDSQYKVALNGYLGNVKVVATISKYENEASISKEIIDVDNIELTAFSYVNDNDLIVNLTAVTDIATKFLKSIADKTKDEIVTMNKYISSCVGIGEIDNTKITPTIVYLNEQNVTNDDTTKYGAVLLSLAKDSNITISNDGVNNKIKIETTLTKLKDAVLKSDVNKDDIEDYVETNLNDANFTIIDIGTDLIDNSSLSSPNPEVKITLDTIKGTSKNSSITNFKPEFS